MLNWEVLLFCSVCMKFVSTANLVWSLSNLHRKLEFFCTLDKTILISPYSYDFLTLSMFSLDKSLYVGTVLMEILSVRDLSWSPFVRFLTFIVFYFAFLYLGSIGFSSTFSSVGPRILQYIPHWKLELNFIYVDYAQLPSNS